MSGTEEQDDLLGAAGEEETGEEETGLESLMKEEADALFANSGGVAEPKAPL